MSARCLVFVLALAAFAAPWGEARAAVDLESFEVGSDPPGTDLFLAVGPLGEPGPDAGPGASVAWPVTVNLDLLGTLPERIEVNFPDRDAVVLTRLRSERRERDGFLWTGRDAQCSALFRNASSGFKGMLSCRNAPYGIDHAAGSPALRLSRYDHAADGVIDDAIDTLPSASPVLIKNPHHVATPDTTIDVLVLFSANASAPPSVWQFAEDVIDQIQLAMDNSTAPGHAPIAEIRLAGAARISRAVQDDLNGDLDALPDDAEVIALRNFWAADVVIYLTGGSGNLVGIAYLPGYQGNPWPGPEFAPIAYAVSLATYAINPGNFVAAHEFAHTFGANHNADHLPINPTPIRPWAFGHWARQHGEDVPIGNRTIMAYAQECLAVVSPCPRILNYSNPGVIVDGWFQTGLVDHRDNARLITEIAPLAAQYRKNNSRIFADGFQ